MAEEDGVVSRLPDQLITDIPESAWLMRELPGTSPAGVERRSRLLGLLGLGLLFTLIFASVPVQTKFVDWAFPTQPSVAIILTVYQTLLFPPIIVYGFAIVASLFRSGSLIKHCLMALAVTTPGFIVFVAIAVIIHGKSAIHELGVLIQVIFSNLIGVALVATTFQIWTRWTLLPLDLRGRVSSRTSITTLIELTAISAIACAVCMSMTIDSTGLLVAIALFAGLGLLAATAIITSLIGFLSTPGNRRARILTVMISLVTALTFSAVSVNAESNWTLTSISNLAWISVGSIYGTVLILLTQGICLVWLRACGWRCIR